MGASGVFNTNAVIIPLANVTIDVGVATRVYSFKVLRRMEFVELQSACDACDATDKITWSVVNATTSDTIITGSVVSTADTPVSVTSVDANKSSIFLPGHTYTLTGTFAGTAANVKGCIATLWVKSAEH